MPPMGSALDRAETHRQRGLHLGDPIWSGSPYVVPSAMSKAGIHAMTKSLAVEWAKYSIRLNAIAPGPFPTEGAGSTAARSKTEGEARDIACVPMGRYGEMHELRNLAVFLVADGWSTLPARPLLSMGQAI